ncbi:uncharacterized protein LOC127104657 [Lathyrus oleraceus]|uniref:uncharacterized protein LOC127104657 n=1 Tax=Pisum sativum TaxID=3888 RepID=UPI0021D02084|nr:uncharacterized protein LOC127104657 [Pisum sativum]
MERLTAYVEALVAAQNQSSPTLSIKAQNTVISKIVIALTYVVQVSSPQYQMPNGYPWGMPLNFTPEGCQPGAQPTTFVPTPIMFVPALVVHTVPHINEPIFHAEASEGLGVCERLDDFEDQFQEMQRKIKALRGNDLFEKNAHDLCLAQNKKIPTKFKLPEFKKYKGNSCTHIHLTMYSKRMSAEKDNDQLLIHYFKDSLTGAAMKWYMGLDNM